MGDLATAIIGILVFIALLVVFAPVIADHIAVADDQRMCTDPVYSNECYDLDDGLLNWCSNETDGTVHCLDADIPVYNVSTGLCTNTSGVHVINGSATSVCDSIGWADGIAAYEDTGLNTTETALLGLIILLLVVGGVFAFVKSTGLQG